MAARCAIELRSILSAGPRLPFARTGFLSLIIGFSLLSSACSWAGQGQPWVSGGPTRTHLLPAWSQESAGGLRPALQAQCERAKRLKAPWPKLCEELAGLAPADRQGKTAQARLADRQLLRWINHRFDAWPIADPNGAARGLLTGYFEPVFNGSLQRESVNQVPLYAVPPDLVAGQPYATREQITRLDDKSDAGKAASPEISTAMQGRELVWLDDPIDAFFLHIQGSGRVKLRDGRLLRVGYAANNGHDYVAIGRVLIERSEISRASMSAQAIRQWLATNPDQATDVMNQNPRYIFFRRLPSKEGSASRQVASHASVETTGPIGPIGSLGVALTPGRSLATDPRYLPPGALLYMRAAARSHGLNEPLARLAVNQDTGSAIRGAVRADLFTGTGESAGDIAGRLKEPLQLWLLWPKGLLPPGYSPVLQADLDD